MSKTKKKDEKEIKNAKQTADEKNARYYSLEDMTPEEMMEDFFAEEERARIQEKLDEGYQIAGVWDENTTDEEFEAMMAPFLDAME